MITFITTETAKKHDVLGKSLTSFNDAAMIVNMQMLPTY